MLVQEVLDSAVQVNPDLRMMADGEVRRAAEQYRKYCRAWQQPKTKQIKEDVETQAAG